MSVRVYADDLGATLAHSGYRGGWEQIAGELVAKEIVFTDVSGKRVAMHGCGATREGGMVRVCIESTAPVDPTKLAIRNAMLCERFADEVNVVRFDAAGESNHLLFTRGDGAKPLVH